MRQVIDNSWDELVEMTGGAASLCYQCGVCTAACPWGSVRGEPLSVRSLMRRAQLGLPGNPDLWLCTTCAQCQAQCPRGVDIVEVFRRLRMAAWQRREVQPGLPTLLWSIYWNNNPWSQPPSRRMDWASKLALPSFDPAQHEILLYIGCTSSYNRRAQKVAAALIRLLQTAGIAYGVLGEQEPCCGEAALSVGHSGSNGGEAYFQEIASHTAHVLREKGVRRMVTISPHCYDAFYKYYLHGLLGEDFEVFHYTQALARWLQEGRLKLERPLAARVAFQDPCYLGRHHGEYEAPRRVLTSIPELELVEMECHAQDGLCCGGGGGRMWLETAPGERFSDLRVQQAARTSAEILATACPFCLVCLDDSAKSLKEDMKVLDVAEVVASSLAE